MWTNSREMLKLLLKMKKKYLGEREHYYKCYLDRDYNFTDECLIWCLQLQQDRILSSLLKI